MFYKQFVPVSLFLFAVFICAMMSFDSISVFIYRDQYFMLFGSVLCMEIVDIAIIKVYLWYYHSYTDIFSLAMKCKPRRVQSYRFTGITNYVEIMQHLKDQLYMYIYHCGKSPGFTHAVYMLLLYIRSIFKLQYTIHKSLYMEKNLFKSCFCCC